MPNHAASESQTVFRKGLTTHRQARILTAVICIAATVAAAVTASAQAPDGAPPPRGDVGERLKRVEDELERQRRENEELRREIETVERRQLSGSGGEAGEAGEEPAGYRVSSPFLRSATRRAYLGGYLDLEYIDAQDADRRFAQHRFVPLIEVDVTDKLRFASEIEFEFGGTDAAGGDGETSVEFAHLDYFFPGGGAFRAGALLVPLGKFNLIHDSPVNDLTDRPLVDRLVIPTTFTEAGLGFFGTLPPAGDWEIKYETYLVNGFRGLDRDGTSRFSDTKGLRSGRGSLKVDSNNSVAGVGRISVSPFLGTEIGGSLHLGKYDEAGDLWLALWAVDLSFKPGRFVEALTPFEIIGEVASAELERNDLARTSGVPDNVWGAYGQINYHFMFDWLVDHAPAVFTDESTFTAVTRLDHVEMDRTRLERLTFGLNFRPIEQTVFKFDYEINLEDWQRTEVRNDAFLFSVATYF